MNSKLLLITIANVFALSSLAQPGTHDILFDHNGIVKSSFGKKSADAAYDVFMLPDGKIIAAGPLYSNEDTLQTGIARYLPDGTPDSSFDDEGELIIGIGTGLYQSKILAVGSDSKMFIGGYKQYSSALYPAITSVLPDGTIDDNFGDNGSYVDTSKEGQITSIAMQSDGKLVVAGYLGSTAGNYKLLARRILQNGIIDPSFDNAIEDIEAYGALIALVTLQPDGKIIIGGTKWSSNADFGLRRFMQDGNVDNTFGTAGLVQTNLGFTDYLRDVIVQNDGKILAVGTSYPSGGPDQGIIIRYNNDGTLDNLFDGDGKKIISDNTGHYFDAIAGETEGKIVVAGSLFSFEDYATVVRLNSNGSLDSTFGTNGSVIDSIGENSNFRGVAVQPDGRILAAGRSSDNNSYNFLLVRYNVDFPDCGIPVNLSTTDITATSAQLNWSPVGFPVKFKIRYKSLSGNVNVITVDDPNATSYLLTGLEPSANYIWRIQEICNGPHSPYSIKQPFETAPLKTSLASTPEISLDVFPNPIADFGVIQFSLANASALKIELLDLQGRKVKNLTEGYFEEGSHQLSFTREDFSSGMFLIQVSILNDLDKTYLPSISKKVIFH